MELYFRIILQNHITGFILRDNITELHYVIILWDYMMEVNYGIINGIVLRDCLAE